MGRLFYAIGGVPWLVWGIAVRVAASCYRALARRLLRPQSRAALLAHRGRRRAGLQRALLRPDHHGRGLAQQPPRLSGSARLGLRDGEVDPGWWVLRGLMWAGLVWGVKTPERCRIAPTCCARSLEGRAMAFLFAFEGHIRRLPYALWSLGGLLQPASRRIRCVRSAGPTAEARLVVLSRSAPIARDARPAIGPVAHCRPRVLAGRSLGAGCAGISQGG